MNPAAEAPEKTKTMTDAERGKLDAFLKRAVASNRREPLIVMVRLAAEEGADVARVSFDALVTPHAK